MAAALVVNEAVYCASAIGELGLEQTFKCVPIHIDIISGLHVAGKRTYSSRAKDVALRLFYICEIYRRSIIVSPTF